MRLNQISVHDRSYLRNSVQDKPLMDIEDVDAPENSLLPSIKTARNKSTNKMSGGFKQTILSSARLSQNDYYEKYIHGKTAGGPGRLSTAESGANFPGCMKKYHKKFIPFDQIKQPSLQVRCSKYLERMEEENLRKDPKLQARLGISLEDVP